MNADAFTAELCARRKKLVQFAWHRCGNRAHAEDLAHDTIVKALQARDRFDGRNMTAWLFRILVNHQHTKYRHSKFEVVGLPARELSCAFTGEAACDAVTVLARIANLSPMHRDALLSVVWHYEDGGSYYYDVGDELKLAHGTVKSRLNRARKVLAAALQPTSEEAA